MILNALNAERETRQNVLLSATLTEGGYGQMGALVAE